MDKSTKRTVGVVSAIVLATTLTACTTSQAEPDAASAITGQCGKAPEVAPSDPDGVIAELSPESQGLYNGYPYDVRASNWTDWLPEGGGPFTVGVAFGPLRNAHQTDLLEAIEEGLKQSPLIADVLTVTTTGDDASAQIQQYNALVQQGADLIIYQPVGADAFVSAVDAAAAEGVPSIAVQSSVATANSVNVNPNQYLVAADAIAGVIDVLGGEGNLLGVHGVPAFSADATTFATIESIVAECPGMKIVGDVTGNFDSSVAKSEVLSFLSTYPGEIDGVFQTAVMAPGIISAFAESGLEVPPVTDIVAQAGSLAYWDQNSDSYTGVGIGQSPSSTGHAIADVALRMLSGGGIKVSDVILDLPTITGDNLDEWVDPAWDLTSVGTAPGPASAELVTAAYLDDIFSQTAN